MTKFSINYMAKMIRLYNSHHQANVEHWPDNGCFTAETCHHIVNL